MSDDAIAVRDLVKTFQRRGQPEIRAVDGLTFSVRRGSIFGLLGPNGAGKTTTLKMLTTLLRPTSGQIAVEGFDPTKDPLEVRRRIAVVIQESAAELFLSVMDNFATFGRFHGLSPDAIRTRTEDVLDQFELRSEASRKVMDLSGGFKRRVQVAKVFMIDTPVVFLDEFSSGMDPILKRSVMARLRQESARGRTIVLTTQILSEAEDLCDDILIMKNGRQAARGDIHTLKMLSGGLFEISVTFADVPQNIELGTLGVSAAARRGQSEYRADNRSGRRKQRARSRRASGSSRPGPEAGSVGRKPRGHLHRVDGRRAGARMSALGAIMYREGKIRATNLTFIFWDLFYPLGYLLVFGVGMTQAMGMKPAGIGVDYNDFFLAGVLGMASFGIASNTAWSFFMDRDNGIFFEMLTYPMRRSEYLLGKGLFNLLISIGQAGVTVVLAQMILNVPIRWGSLPLLATAVFVGTAGWFFFYAIFALIIRRNDLFNTVTSVFYFVLLFASSMFYPVDPLPSPLRELSWANPITWHVDVLRYATIGVGDPSRVWLEATAFLLFTGACFTGALLALKRQ